MSFEDTSLWQTTLADQEGVKYKNQRELLRTAFRQMRERATSLAALIARDNPPLTVHDITHLDALWEMASIIVGPTYSLSPTEAFVLGGTFLVHDLAMSTACYPEISILRAEPRWNDLLHKQLETHLRRKPTETDVDSADADLCREVDAQVMRQLHAQKAEDLPMQEWKSGSNSFYLIDSPELRESLGPLIGRIASSHWWNIDLLPAEFDSLRGAPNGLPPEWKIDPLKIALILRVADATQIDERRAPSFVFALRKPKGMSKHHWEFQNILLRPTLQNEQLTYSSKRPFSADEAESWWLCFDTLHMADRELRNADELSLKCGRQRFDARGVANCDSPTRLATTVRVSSWEPVEAKVKVTDVATLAHRLGGRQLYGQEAAIPLRELVQNACDAIRARRILEDRESIWGTVTVRCWSQDDDHYLEVSDDGIGMSAEVLAGPLLDFGESYWGTDLMMREYPGLFAKGFRSTGQFGLGFFSVFMWARAVSVVTRRCRDGHDQTRILEFSEGLDARPLLRMAKDYEQRSEPGTSVLLKLKAAPMSEEGLLRQVRWYREEWSLADLCEWLFPAIDASLVCKSDGKSSKPIKASDWLRLNGTKLACRIFADERPRSDGMKKIYDKYSSGMRPLINADGNVVGRAVMCGHMFGRKTDGPGVVTTNGIRVESIRGFLGILEGVAENAPRDSATPLVDGVTLAKWATEQAEIAPAFLRSAAEKHEVASMVAYCGGDTLSLPIARKSGRWISADQIRKCKLPNELKIIAADDHDDERSKPLKLDSNVFTVSNGYFYWGIRERRGRRPAWPPVPERFGGYNVEGENYSPLWFALVEAIADSWNESLDAVMSASSIRTEKAGEHVRIGMRGQRVAKAEADVIRKP